MKALGRIAMIALAAAVFIGLTALYVDTLRPPARYPRFEQRERRRRPREPRLSAVSKFLVECGIFVLIAVAGRKVLRLRLSD